MNNNFLLKTLSYPLFSIGIIMIVLGLRWVFHSEPWMLDEVANVERLGISFDELFSEEINNTLPAYLKQIYQFFGLWVVIIGLFISSYSLPKMIIQKNNVSFLLAIVGFLITAGLYFGYKLIPSSHFISLGWGMAVAFSISLFAFYKIHYTKNG
jgi:hypothetical protein